MYTLKIICGLLLITATKTGPTSSRNVHPDAHLNIYELLAKYGYPVETHEVQTEDGYILTLQRIPSQDGGPPILLMHGLGSSGVDFLNLGPGKALGLLLADQGYDVWLGNQRGSTWSRKHISLDPDLDAEKFFDFSFHEIGLYDLPAKIDYILNTTGVQKVSYVGHSQGTTDFFVMASSLPEYNEKIRLMTALAPAVLMGDVPNPIIRALMNSKDKFDKLVEKLNIHEFIPYFEFWGYLGDELCGSSSDFQELCVLFLNLISGMTSRLDPNFIPVITSNAPAGTSIKEFQHYFQEILSTKFERYDYGLKQNLIKYGTDVPPVYEIAKVTAPVSLYYADNDWLVSEEDVQRLAKQLPNLVGVRELAGFNHFDFIWARDADELLYNNVIQEINSFN